MSKSDIESFMLRKERYRKMLQDKMVPQTNHQRFIVPCVSRCFGFKTNQYAKNAQKLEEFIDKASFETFVKNANKIVDKQLLEKAKNETASFFSMTSFFLKLSIMLGFLTFSILACIVYIDFEPEKQATILHASIVLIIISVVVASICPIYLYLRQYIEYDYDAIIYDQLSKLAQQENLKFQNQSKQYIKWKFQKSFFWIELQINKQILKKKQKKLVYRFIQNDSTPPLFQ